MLRLYSTFPAQLADTCTSQCGDNCFLCITDGTGLETPFTAQFRLTVHKTNKLPTFIPTPFEAPILETEHEICWHAFTFNVRSDGQKLPCL